MQHSVLVIEDDRDIIELLRIHLGDLNCDITAIENGNDGLKTALTESFDLILLDVMLPGMEGTEICRRIRGKEIGTPILMLTSKSEEFDKVLGLEMVYTYGDLTIDLDKRRVSSAGTRVDLSPKEFELLIIMAANPGKCYDRSKLLNLIWGYDFDGYEHTVNSHINRLRTKIEPDPAKPTYILTNWGVGYRFNDDL